VAFLDDVMRLIPKPRIALEIGLGAGGTHLLLAEIFERVITIERDRDRACHTGLGLGSKSTIIVANSKKPETLETVWDVLGDEDVDLLFIDGHHSYESCKADHKLYAGLVRPGGIVAFHDSAKPDCGVKDYLAGMPFKLMRYEFMVVKKLDAKEPKFKEAPGARQGIAYYVVEA
jgi:predicted O-methyltransferase YrrM